MLVRSSKFVLHMLATSLIGLVLISTLVIWQLSRGPISVGFLTPYIEEALSVENAPVHVRLGDTVLTWAGFDRTLDVRAVGLDVISNDGSILASVPEISVRFSAQALFNGLLAPTSLELLGPRFRFVRYVDGGITFDLPDMKQSRAEPGADLVNILKELVARPDRSRRTGYLKRLVVTSALVEYEDRQNGIGFNAPRVNLVFERDVAGIRASGSVAVDIDGKPLRVQVSGIYSVRSGNTDLGLTFADVDPVTFASLVDDDGVLDAIDLRLNGTIALSLDRDFVLEDVGFDVDSPGGTVVVPTLFPEPVEIANFAVRGRARDDFRSILVEEGRFEVLGSPVSVSGAIVRRGRRMSTDFDVGLRHVDVNDIEHWWPERIASNARSWVTQNLRDGMVEAARLNISGSAPLDDMAAFTVGDIDGRIDATNVTVHYLRPMDPVRGVNAVGTFDASGFAIDVTAGEVRRMRVDSGHITISGLDGDPRGAMLNVNLTIAGAARGALELLDQKPLRLVRRIGVDPATTAGSHRTQLIVQVPLAGVVAFEDIRVAAASGLSGFGLARGPLGLPVENGELSLQVDAEKMIVDGNLLVSGVPAGIAWTEWFTDDTPTRRTYQVRAILNNSARDSLAIDLAPWLHGPVGVGLTYSEARTGTVSGAAEIDLTSATMAIKEAGWRKSAGIPGRAFLRFSGDRDRIRRFDRFSLAAADLVAEGEASLRPAAGRGFSPARVTLQRLAFGGTDIFAAVGFAEDGAIDLSLGGRKLDLRREVEAFAVTDEPAPSSVTSGRPVYIRISEEAPLTTVRLGEQTVLSNLRGTIATQGRRVQKAQLAANLSDGAVTLEIAEGKGARDVHLVTTDGGGLIRALDLSDAIVGGRLELRGRIEDDVQPMTFGGQVDLTDFYLTESSGIARALTLASFQGVSDTIAGRGLAIRRAEVPLTFTPDEVVITDAKLRGADVGVLAEGRVDRKAGTIDLAGEVAPAYTLNSLLGNIPLIGKLLTGGGDGVFAASYTIRGPLDDPQVSVNPLSVLTPGIIRRLLTGFGSDNQVVQPNDPNAGGEPPSADSIQIR